MRSLGRSSSFWLVLVTSHFLASPSQVASHFFASPSQVASHYFASPSQVTSHKNSDSSPTRVQVAWLESTPLAVRHIYLRCIPMTYVHLFCTCVTWQQHGKWCMSPPPRRPTTTAETSHLAPPVNFFLVTDPVACFHTPQLLSSRVSPTCLPPPPYSLLLSGVLGEPPPNARS